MTDRPRWIPEVADELLTVGEAMGARRGHMFGHPALYAGRRLAACAYGEGIGMKLPAHRVEVLIANGLATLFQPYGKARMLRWAHLPAGTGDEVTKLADLIAESLAHVSGDEA